MRSVSVLDRGTPAASPQEPDLLVLWQHPETREFIPVGTFGRHEERYTFVYTRAAETVTGFRPLPGLKDLHQRYEFDYMPALFEQRVMHSDRPDYDDYIRSLGLDPALATPWEQIVASGGTRAGDTLHFMQVPTVIDGVARARFFVNGVRHVAGEQFFIGSRSVEVSAEQHEAALQSLAVGEKLLIEQEVDNPLDRKACMVTSGGFPLGWVPRALSAGIRTLLTDGPLPVTVVRVGTPGSPSHQRLVVELEAEVADDFKFDLDGRWEPLAPQ